jgi:hypothetical protein
MVLDSQHFCFTFNVRLLTFTTTIFHFAHTMNHAKNVSVLMCVVALVLVS